MKKMEQMGFDGANVRVGTQTPIEPFTKGLPIGKTFSRHGYEPAKTLDIVADALPLRRNYKVCRSRDTQGQRVFRSSFRASRMF